jgi:glycolate oxidase
MITKQTLGKLRDIVGVENYLDSAEDKIAYSYDGTPLLQQLPVAILIPRSVTHISQILKLANEAKFSVVPRGSGSGLSGGSIPVDDSIVLLMNQWNKIQEIDSANLTAWVEPGVITGQLQSAVEEIGLFYPPDPGSSTICTIGGNVAENAGGLRGLKYGVTKNYVMGIEVVLPTGEVIVTGGKSVKDVAGYNLKDFFVGSEGTLGVFTRVLLKLLPKPDTSKTMLVYYDKVSDAADSVSELIASKITPAALEFLDRTTIRCVEDYAHLGLPNSIESLLMIEVDGHSSVVDEDVTTIRSICTRHKAIEVKVAKDRADAARLRSARKVAFSALARIRPTTILEDATVPRSEVARLLDQINHIAAKHNLLFGNFGHAGDGNMHPTCLTDERDKSEISRAKIAFEEIFMAAVDLGGTITGEHGTGLAKKQFFEKVAGPAQIEMMRNIKAVIDPNSVLNPGKIFSLSPRCEGTMPKSQEQIKKFLDMGAYS